MRFVMWTLCWLGLSRLVILGENMKPFYLTKNQQGYYRAVFYNQQTGLFCSCIIRLCKEITVLSFLGTCLAMSI